MWPWKTVSVGWMGCQEGTRGLTGAAAAPVPAVRASGAGSVTARVSPTRSEWKVSFPPRLIPCSSFAVQCL